MVLFYLNHDFNFFFCEKGPQRPTKTHPKKKTTQTTKKQPEETKRQGNVKQASP